MAQIYARGSKGHHTFYLSVDESGTNIENNTSTVTINFWLVDDNNWYFDTWGSNLTYTVTVNGTTYSGNIPDHDTKTTYIITNQTQTITHNNDGTKQISFSFSTTDTTGAYYTPGTASASGTLDLTTLPRASTVTVNNQTIASSSGNVSFSITSKADFYHKYRYTINGTTSSWLTAGRVNTTTTSFNIAYSTILSAMNNTNLSTLTVEVQTYNSSTYSTLVGTKSGSGNITVTLKPTAPTLTTLGFRSRSSGVNSNITTPTAGYTTVALTAWSHGTSSGASSYTTYFSVDQNASLQTTSATANNTVIETNTLPANAKQYTLTYTAYTIDSRGNQSVNATKTVTVYGYTAPLLTLTAYRTATNGASDTTEDGAGLYSYVAFSNTLRGQTDANGSLRSGNQNAIVSATCKYGSTSVTSGQHIALSEADTRTFTYTVQDRFTTTSTSVTIPQAKFPLDLYDDGSGNVGVGLGAIAEANKVTSALPIEVSGSVKANYFKPVSIATTGSGAYVKIKINSKKGWMLSFTVAIYTSYNPFMIRISGYNYGTSHWYSPRAEMITASASTSSTSLPIKFGYDADYELWVCIPVASYYGVSIIDVVNGYIQADDVNELFTLTQVSEIPATVQYTLTAEMTSDKLKTAINNPTSTSYYYLPFVAGLSNDYKLNGINGGLYLVLLYGSTSVEGRSELALGNSTSVGTNGNERGWLTLYGRQAYRASLTAPAFMSANLTQTLPNANGEIALHDVAIWTGSLTGTNSIDLDISGYKRIRIYAQYYDNRQMIWEVDVTKLHATTQYRCNHCELSWLDSAWYHTIFETFISKAKFSLSNVYNMNTSGTTYAQNNNTSYQIYQIDGII